MKNYKTVDTPVIVVEETDEAGDILLNFYKGLGWNGDDFFDPRKVKVSTETWNGILDLLKAKADGFSVGMLMVNSGPSADDEVGKGKVRLYDGWVTPDTDAGN